MKSLITSTFVFLILGQGLLGQSLSCKVTLVKSKSIISKIIDNQPLTNEDSIDITILQDDQFRLDLPEYEYDHSSVKENSLIIQFFNSINALVTNQIAGVYSISLTEISTGASYVIPTSLFPLSGTYIPIKLKEYLGDKPKNKEKIRLTIQTNNGKAYDYYFKYINGWQPYNFADNKIGLWFPVNMYSSSFERSKNGVLFTAMPIGLAIGGKYNISQKFYLGISGTLNYTVANASDSLTTKSYFLQDFSVGPLIDIGGYAYIGYTYPINLTNEPARLKPQFVIGVGISLTQLLKGK
jgi:hypothetical protein